MPHKKKPARRSRPHRQPPSAPPPAPVDPAEQRRAAYAQVAKSFEAELAAAVAEMKAEWLQATGQEMPTKLDEMPVAARMAGWSAAEAEAGDYTLAQVHRQLQAQQALDDRNRKGIAAEVVKAMAAAEPVDEEPTHSTKSKREELDGYYIGLVRRRAEQQGQEENVVVAEIDSISAQDFADVLFEEFSFRVCARTVKRWRKARAKAERKARTMPSPEPADDDHEEPREVIDRDPRQCGLSSRSRIDGITWRAKPTPEEQDREAVYRQLEEEASRLLEG